MLVTLKPGTEGSTQAALAELSAIARDEVSDVIQVLEMAESLQDAKQALLDDMLIDGSCFSVFIRENFQFVVAGVLGQSTDDEVLMIEVKLYL